VFTAQLEHIFILENLHQAFDAINQNALGLDDISFDEFKEAMQSNLSKIQDDIIQGSYIPEPLKRIEIGKENTDEMRPISLASIKDKIVQRTLNEALKSYFEEHFSDKSYAYRAEKSMINAINRAQGFLNEKLHWVLKTDIDNFFETINHEKLLDILTKQISDKRILKLIALFLETGTFFKYNFLDHALGVHQGDILSPLLSNIYLDIMDRFLEQNGLAFVRYADDFALFVETQEKAYEAKEKLISF
jgi:group II intron reverse transcriptase/maturase